MDVTLSVAERIVIGLQRWLSLDFYEFALVIIFATFALVLYRLHKTQESEFAFEDMFTHGDRDGKASVFRLVVFGAFMVHSWVIVRQESLGYMTETTLATYAGIWSGSYIVLRGIQAKGGTTSGQVQSASGGAGQGGGGQSATDGRTG